VRREDINSVAIHPDGLYLAAGFADKIRFLNILIGTYLPTKIRYFLRQIIHDDQQVFFILQTTFAFSTRSRSEIAALQHLVMAAIFLRQQSRKDDFYQNLFLLVACSFAQK